MRRILITYRTASISGWLGGRKLHRRSRSVERMIRVRDFSWTYFTLTGDVDAFLLYKQMDKLSDLEGVQQTEELLDSLDEWEEA